MVNKPIDTTRWAVTNYDNLFEVGHRTRRDAIEAAMNNVFGPEHVRREGASKLWRSVRGKYGMRAIKVRIREVGSQS